MQGMGGQHRQSAYENIFSESNLHFVVFAKFQCNLFLISIDNWSSATIRTVSTQSKLKEFGIVLDLCAKSGTFSWMEWEKVSQAMSIKYPLFGRKVEEKLHLQHINNVFWLCVAPKIPWHYAYLDDACFLTDTQTHTHTNPLVSLWCDHEALAHINQWGQDCNCGHQGTNSCEGGNMLKTTFINTTADMSPNYFYCSRLACHVFQYIITNAFH